MQTTLISHNPRHKAPITSIAAETLPSFDLWHYQLGEQLISTPLLPTPSPYSQPCLICHLAKQYKLPFNDSLHLSSFLFELGHLDL